MSTIIGYIQYSLSLMFVTFWSVIWIMHLCALTNAKLKLNKRSCSSAASRRKRKLQLIKEKILSTTKSSDFCAGYAGCLMNKANQKVEKQKFHPTLNRLQPIDSSLDYQPVVFTTLQPPFLQTPPHDPESPRDHADSISVDTINGADITRHDCTTQDGLRMSENQVDYNNNNDSLDVNKIALKPAKHSELSNNTTTKTTNHCCDTNNTNGNDHYEHSHYHQEPYNLKSMDAHPCVNLPLPGVSILKPLVGVDANLQKNLESFFLMDYPTYEILFCIQDHDDAAILVVEQLLKLYPHVDARLFIGGERVGVNPKINNMQPAYAAIKYELVLISDSGISMKPDTLLDMVEHMHEDIALVHQLPFVCDGRKGFQSVIEKVYFGTAHARAYLTADLLRINCPSGMSALMRKHLLDEVGGIRAFGKYLAEDFFFAKSFTDRGWRISICSQPAWQNSAISSDNTFSTLSSRIQRWIKLRFAMVPQWTLLEPFSECLLLGALGAVSISFLWALDPIAIFLFHVLLWFLFDYKLLCTIQNGPLTFSKTDYIVAWLIRECTALTIFLKALANPKVTWRSKRFRLKWGGYAEEISSPLDSSALSSCPLDYEETAKLQQRRSFCL